MSVIVMRNRNLALMVLTCMTAAVFAVQVRGERGEEVGG